MSSKDFFKIIALAVGLFAVNCGVVFAVEDGFAAAKQIHGKYFTVFYESGVDVPALVERLNIGPSDNLLAGKAVGTGFLPEEELAEMLDTLFIRVCDILDMRLYSFEGNIKICRDEVRLKQIYRNLFDKDAGNQRSFYVYGLNTVYVSADNLKRGIIGHEIGHAVISRYFVVLPSVKIQEVLAGYVEYQLRRPGQ